MSAPIRLIVGLQNPGSVYEHTRHNAGAWFVTRFARHHGLSFKNDKKLHCEWSEFKQEQLACKFARPLDFMNHSGQAVLALSQFYRISPAEILIVHDELDLPAGRVKLKTGGGHGGHNGLRDIINRLGSSEFHRLRIGIGHPGHKDQVSPYVLNKPTPDERRDILDAIERGLTLMPSILSGDLGVAMTTLNSY